MNSIGVLALALLTFGAADLANGQSAIRAPEIAVRLSVATEHPKDPTEAKAILTITNVGRDVVVETSDTAAYHLHLTGPKGEPPQTPWYSKLLAGELPMTLGPVTRDVTPGSSVNRTFILSAFYDLTTPGTYTVYVEVHDSSGAWVETNKTTFQIDSKQM